MTTRDILSKLSEQLDEGITSEVQVVYLVAGIRKLMERDGVKAEYPDLNFHCDWTLHSKLEGSAARAVLSRFDTAHLFLRDRHLDLHDLPSDLRSDIDRISKMRSFKQELSRFLETYGLPPLEKHRPDWWAHFLHLYARVIEDIPLVVRGANAHEIQNISEVVIHFEEAREDFGGEALFKVTWTIHDNNGQSGEIFVINSFTR